jgi:signal transduction histidine kinase
VQEQERRHVARELHDEVGQVLTGLKLSLEAMTRLPPAEVQGGLAAALELVTDLTARVRDLSADLRPSLLDVLGLLPALRSHFQRYTAQTGVRVTFAATGLDARLPPEVETVAYRVIQEGLTNVARHAGVGEAAVRLRREPGRLWIQVEDAGTGFDPAAAQAGDGTSGLLGMRERVGLLGGRLEVEAAPGRGARLTAELPVEEGGGGLSQ